MATTTPFKIHGIIELLMSISLFFVPLITTFASEYDYDDEPIQPIQLVQSVQQSNLQEEADVELNNNYAFDKCRSLQAKPFDENLTKKKLIIIGDSQGCDFLNGVIENGYLKNYQVQFRFIPYACQRIPNENINHYISPKHRRFCLETKRIDSLEKAKQQVNEADVVIFSPLWKSSVANKLPTIFNYLGIKKQQRLVVIGYKFFGKISVNKYMNLSNDERRLVRNDVGDKSLKINSILTKTLGNNVTFINPHKLVCGDAVSCPVFTNDLKLISYDGRHLTQAGARYMGKILFQNTILGSI